jgi:hypothetical protein
VTVCSPRKSAIHGVSRLSRNMAALRLARMRSRERANSPISSCDFAHSPLTDASRSPMVTLSAISVKSTLGRTIQWATRNESNAPTTGIRAMIPTIRRRAVWISFSTASSQKPIYTLPNYPSRTGRPISRTVLPFNDSSRRWTCRCPAIGKPCLSSAGKLPKVWARISPLLSWINVYATPS